MALTLDYIAFLDYSASYLKDLLNAEPLEWGIKSGRPEPDVSDFPYIKIMYPEKSEERIKSGVSTNIYLSVPLTICINENTIEGSREKAWNLLKDLEGEIREDFKLGDYTHLVVATPRDASGEDYEGREYRLNLVLECWFMLAK